MKAKCHCVEMATGTDNEIIDKKIEETSYEWHITVD